MLVAVGEIARSAGKTNRGETATGRPVTRRAISLFAMRHVAFAVTLLAGVAPTAYAQIVAAPGSGAHVIQTQNGLPQVNIAKPSGAGVSMNTYSQFDVQKQGAILNNSAAIVQTQQAGFVNGNPNLAAGQSAKIIVNQVNSNSPSQLRGYVEVAGSRAEVVIANASGLIVDGAGFINTSRGILTTGSPVFGANGALTGFDVRGGQISVQGAGMNASNVDQVDLIARAVQANAAIYGNTLNVITGSNHVDHDTLAATPISGEGAAPAFSIDVGQLGGMYANRIFLASNEFGVGVSNAGVLAAQAGDLTLAANGRLSLTGKTTASGNLAINAHDGIDNSGTTYAEQSVKVDTAADLQNTGTLAAQQSTNINAGSVASSGTLGAGINSDGSIAGAGDLTITTSGALKTTGNNTAGGNTSLSGAAVDLSGSRTSANGNLTLKSNTGDLNLTGATATSGGVLSATAAGTLTNDGGKLSSTGAQSINAGALSNQSGQIVSQTTLDVKAGGAANNNRGVIQASGHESVAAGSLDNTAGRIASLGSDGLTVTTTGTLVNASGTTGTGVAGGVIGSNGALQLTGGAISNQGQFNSTGDTTIHAQSLDNHAGSVVSGAGLKANVEGAINNAKGTLSGSATTVTAASADNTGGTIEGDQLALSTTGDLVNRNGAINQYSGNDQKISVGGTLDNASGAIASNVANLNVSAQTITNDTGSIQHAGTGTLTVAPTGTMSNTGGKVATNGALNVTGGAVSNQGQFSAKGDAALHVQSLDNHAGSVIASGNLGATIAGALNNTNGTLSGAATTVTAASADNSSGTIEGDQLALSTTGQLSNHGGTIRQYGTTDQIVTAGGALDNTGGTIASNAANLKVSAQSITNDSGFIQHAGTGALTIDTQGALSSKAGQIATNGALVAQAANLDNTSGTLSAQRTAQIDAASSLVNHGGTLYGHDGLTATTQGAFDNTSGSTQTAGNLSLTAGGALSNQHGSVTANGAHGAMTVSAASIDDTSGTLTNAGDGATTVTATTGITNTGGTLGGNGDVTVNARTLTNNAGARLVAAGAANLNVASRVDNTSGTIYGGTALNLNQAGATVANDAGSLEGGQDVSVRVASLSSSGGAIKANRDIAASGVITGDGQMTSGRNLTLNVAGDYTNDAANHLHADGNMSVSATGTLTNTGTLASTGALTVSGTNVINAAGADINSASTTVSAGGTLNNAGRIEGDAVTTNSATLVNTGSVIGNAVQVNATDVQNSGAAAVIAGAQSLKIYAANSVTNADGALIYSAGNLEIARDGARDGSGLLADQMNTLTNSAGDIEAAGDIDIAARTVNNLRTGVVTQAGTPQSAGATTLTLWTAGLSGDDLGYYSSSVYPTLGWGAGGIGFATIGALSHPISVTVPKSQVTNLNTTAQTLSFTQPLTDTYLSASSPTTEVCNNSCVQVPVEQTRTITNNPTQYYNSITDNGSTYTITLWPDFDPNKNIRPDNVTIRTDLGSDNHDYVEMSRTVTTTATTDQLINAGNAATLRAQGTIRINANGGSINNESSTMAAGGNLTRVASAGAVHDDNGLFSIKTAPGATYLVATDPRFTSHSKFISSDYMLDALGLNPQATEKRLGDGSYEEQLVMNQVTQLTGRTFLTGYTDNMGEYTALMNNGVASAKAFGLTPGIGLTDTQMKHLTTDMVWLVSQDVTLPDGTHQSVLVPKLYLAQADTVDLQSSGAIVSGNSVSLNATGNVNNTGHVVGDVATTVLGNNIVNGGVIGSGGTTVVAALQDVRNTSGQIGGVNTVVQAGRDVINETQTTSVSNTLHEDGFTSSASSQGTNAIGTISASGNAVVLAGRDVTLTGASIQAGGDATVGAGRNINAGTTTLTSTQDAGTTDGLNGGHTSTTQNVGSSIAAGGKAPSCVPMRPPRCARPRGFCSPLMRARRQVAVSLIATN